MTVWLPLAPTLPITRPAESRSRAAAGAWTGLTDWVFYDLYSSFPDYSYATDPHAAGIVHNNTDGNTYGYLLDGSFTRAIQVDMTSFIDPALVPPGA